MKTKTIAFILVLGLILPTLAMAKASKKKISGQLNLNTASVEQLDQLPGMSPKKAKAVAEYRKEHPFKSVDELDDVKGFSPKGIEKIKSYVSVKGENNLSVEGGKAKKGKKEARKKSSSHKG